MNESGRQREHLMRIAGTTVPRVLHSRRRGAFANIAILAVALGIPMYEWNLPQLRGDDTAPATTEPAPAVDPEIARSLALLKNSNPAARDLGAKALLHSHNGLAIAIDALKDSDPHMVDAIANAMLHGPHPFDEEASLHLRSVLGETWPEVKWGTVRATAYFNTAQQCLRKSDRKALYLDFIHSGGPYAEMASSSFREDPTIVPGSPETRVRGRDFRKDDPVEQTRYEQAVAQLRAMNLADARSQSIELNPAIRKGQFTLIRVLNDPDSEVRMKALLCMGSPRGVQLRIPSLLAMNDLENAIPWFTELTRGKDPVVAALAFDWMVRCPEGFVAATEMLKDPDLDACGRATIALAFRKQSLRPTPGEAVLVDPLMADLMARPFTDKAVIDARRKLFAELTPEEQLAVALALLESAATGPGPEQAFAPLNEYRRTHPEINPRLLIAAGRGNMQAVRMEASDLRPDNNNRVEIQGYVMDALKGHDPLAGRGAVLMLAASTVIPNEPIMHALMMMRPTDDEWKDAVAKLVCRNPSAEFDRWTNDAIFGDKEARRATHRLLQIAGGARPPAASSHSPGSASDGSAPTVPWLSGTPVQTQQPYLKLPIDTGPILLFATAAIIFLGFCLLVAYLSLKPYGTNDHLVLEGD